MERGRESELDRGGRELEFDETFAGTSLDERRWIAHYLPQWSTPDRTAARYELGDAGLSLLIEADQPAWCPELDGELRVSSIQTGAFSGPHGSEVGQHRFRPEARVRTAQPRQALYTPRYGLVELRCRAPADPRLMVALWMIGFEDEPEQSAEICVAEIFGRDVAPDRAGVGMGVHPFGDPSLVDDFERVDVAIDATQFHVYSADWTPDGIAWYVDDRLVRTVRESPDYPMQLMLSLYEFPADATSHDGAAGDEEPRSYPKAVEVDWVRGYRPLRSIVRQ
jgi:Glycosyl hydrolases family 16